GPGRAPRRHRPSADRDAGHRQSRVEVALRHRAGELAEQLRQARGSAVEPRAARVPGELVRDNGYSIKKLQRLLVLSAVYQSSSADSPAAYAKDAANRWYWRANRRRMTAEEVRDSALFVAGALDEKMGGPSEDLAPSATRRTLYGKVSRYRLDQFLQLFDFPAATISAEQRFSTNVPLQRLFLMNSDFVQQQAEKLARRIEGETDNTARVKKAYRILFGRDPRPEELSAGLEYLSAEPLRTYEERKLADAMKKDTKDGEGTKEKASKPAPKPEMGEGMMAGVTKPGGATEDD